MYGLGWEDTKNADSQYRRDYQRAADVAATLVAGAGPVPEPIRTRWGDDSQILMVKEGQSVKAEQQIGWAGRTGFDANGIHLHVMFARLANHPDSATGKIRALWTLFDPYGLYALELNCYQGEYPSGAGPSQHASIYAPFPPDFLGVT